MADVLVIDDDPDVRCLLGLFLEEGGHAVREAAGGAEALRLFRGRPAGVVFCDMDMPGPGGADTIRELRRLAPDARLVAMSGGEERLPPGADRWLGKPFDLGAALALADAAPHPPPHPA